MEPNTEQALAEVTRRIVSAADPESIILFGSHAWGAPTADSDIDLLVILKESDQPAYRRARDLYRTLRGLPLPVELVVRTHAEVARARRVPSSLEHRALRDGRVLHHG